VSTLDANMLRSPRLSFDPAIPSQTDPRAFVGLRRFGPYDSSRVDLAPGSVLFVFPETLRGLARKLVVALGDGLQNFPGFGQLFRIPFPQNRVTALVVDGDVSTPDIAAISYREAIARWNNESRTADPKLAMVLVRHSEQWETQRPYYEAKSSFARLGIPTQMITAELLENDRDFTWSIANIALAAFAKLGGVPWVVEAPSEDRDLIIGIGRADIRVSQQPRRMFGYALSFASNGAYRQTWSFTPTSDEATYLQLLENVIADSIAASSAEEPFRHLVIHLGKKAGRKEAIAARNAIARANLDLPYALLRLDESSLYDIADGRNGDTYAPPKGLAVKLDRRHMLLQSEGASTVGVPSGPLLIELDGQSSIDEEWLDSLTAQAFRLAHANWRAFNARSQPVTLVYGELLARLVGYLEEVSTWDPQLLRNDLRDRPWFL
jgi:hypothetical protein